MTKNSSLPQVAFVGRMNVGKSTLFNRLSTDAKSIVLDYPGVTRDAVKDNVEWQGREFIAIDSGGIHLHKTQDELFEKIRAQVLKVIEMADVIIFMVDGTVGVLPEDRDIATYLHKLRKPVILVVNKTDARETNERLYEFNQLGFSVIVPVSAQHGRGVNDLLDEVVKQLPEYGSASSEAPAYKVVFLGKPNVGKSSLLNALLKQERSVVSPQPGTTREAISERVNFYQESIELTDTPGVRRKRSVGEHLELLMVKSAFQALKGADIVVLLIDGSSPTLVDQELKLAFYAFTEQYKNLILLVNKADLVTDVQRASLDRSFEEYQHLLKKIPVLSISCLSGKNIGRVLPLIQEVWKLSNAQWSDGELTKLLKTALTEKPLYHKGERLELFAVTQIHTAPPTILLEVSDPRWFGQSQLSFFENILRSEYDIQGVPIKLITKKHHY